VAAGNALTAYARHLATQPAARSTGSTAAASGANALTADVRALQAQTTLLSAQQSLATAERNLAGATLTAPAPGQVAAIGVTAGVTAAGTAAITIVGPGVTEVTGNVPASALGTVKVGQTAHVSPAGQPTLDGTVTRVGLLPSSTANASSVTYPVTVLVPTTSAALASGARVPLSLVTATVSRGLVVPLSAITRTGATSGTVQVLTGADTAVRQVALGAIGTTTAQVTSGVAEGDLVVLADREEPLPANNSQANRRLGVGTGASGSFGGTGQIANQPGGNQPGARPGG